MAHYRLPGPTCSWSQNLQVGNGDSALSPGCPRGPVDGAAPGHADEIDPRTLWRRARALHEACTIGLARAPEAIVRETGLDDLPALGESLIEGALVLMAVVGASTALGGAVGALAGAALGALAGGVGAVPGAAAGVAVGGQLGMDAGIAVLGWLGLGFLAVAITRGLGEVSGNVMLAIGQAWDAEGKPQRQEEVQAAGQLLADAIGQLMLLIVMAVVARLSASQAGTATAKAAGTVEDLYAALRQSRLGVGFADWVQANAKKLLGNPRLRMHNVVGGTSGKGVEAATPSQLRKAATPVSSSTQQVSPTPAYGSLTPPARNQRPSWRQSEQDLEALYGPSGYESQASFLKNKPTYHGAAGSTRPDLYRAGEAIEIKNYDVSTTAGQNRLVSNVVSQAQARAKNLPVADVQKLIVDVRGQNVGTATLNRIANEIATRSGGLLPNSSITFWR